MTYPDHMPDKPEDDNYENNPTSFSKSSATTSLSNSDKDSETEKFKPHEFTTRRVANSDSLLNKGKTEKNTSNMNFNPQLSWSHYQALMHVKKQMPDYSMNRKQQSVPGISEHWNGIFTHNITSVCLKFSIRKDSIQLL